MAEANKRRMKIKRSCQVLMARSFLSRIVRCLIRLPPMIVIVIIAHERDIMKTMRVYISGIAGVAMGPLALGAKSLGMTVFGSDLKSGLVVPELEKAGIEVNIGAQDGEYLRKKAAEEGGVDWYVHTSAVRPGNKELSVAHELGLKISKRDEFIEKIVEDYDLKMIGVAGTHGKTTTTAGILWLCLKLGLRLLGL